MGPRARAIAAAMVFVGCAPGRTLAPDAGSADSGSAEDAGGPDAGSSDAGSVNAVAIASDADWILKTQLADGALCIYVDQLRIVPYFSNFGAWGLAVAYRVTGSGAYRDAAWSYLSWYAQNEQADAGYVTDYDVDGGAEVSTGTFDSTDSYAGTFLLAADELYRDTQDGARLSALALGIRGAVHAIESTQDADGLTWAKPGYAWKYLMDQAEAYSGLVAGADLATALGDPALASEAAADAARMKAGVDTMWDAQTLVYAYGKDGNGGLAWPSSSYYYPDSMSQVWAVGLGNWAAPSAPLIPTTRAPGLVNVFVQAWPGWDVPSTPVTNQGGSGTADYQPQCGLGLAAVGDIAEASDAGTQLHAAALAANRAWPFHVGAAGALILLESIPH